jgi:hypothetical protein
MRARPHLRDDAIAANQRLVPVARCELGEIAGRIARGEDPSGFGLAPI